MIAVTSYIRQIRLLKGVSQRTLADAMGLSARQVNRWETGHTPTVGVEAFLRALIFLDIQPNTLLELYAGPQATAEDGQTRAEADYNQRALSQVELRYNKHDPDDVRAAISKLQTHIIKMAAYTIPGLAQAEDTFRDELEEEYQSTGVFNPQGRDFFKEFGTGFSNGRTPKEARHET